MKPHPTKSKPRIAPYLAPRPPAQVDAGWAKRAGYEIGVIYSGSNLIAGANADHFAAIITKHAPEALPEHAADSASAARTEATLWQRKYDEASAQLAVAQSEVGRLTKERDELRAQLERLTAPIPDAEEYAKHVIAHLYPDHSNGARLVQIALNEWLNRHLATLRRERDELRAELRPTE